MTTGQEPGHQPRRVVVTGMGVVSPVGNDLMSTWDALLAGTSGGGPITLWETTEDFSCRIGCEVKGFDPLDYVEKARSEALRPRVALLDRGLCPGAPLGRTRGRRARGNESKPLRGHLRQRHRWGRDLRGTAQAPARGRPQACEPVFHPDVHPGHFGRAHLYAVESAGSELRHRVGVRFLGARDRRCPALHPPRRCRRHDSGGW